MQPNGALYVEFERFAANTLQMNDGYAQWWEVLISAWDRDDMELMSLGLHNLAAECFYEVSELSNTPIDQVVNSVIETFKYKNAAYGNNTLDNFYRVQRDFGLNPVAGLLTRMSDKMSRIENLIENPTFEFVDETLEDTFTDLGAYAIITMMVINKNNKDYKISGYKYAQAGVSVDDPVVKTGVVDEYRRHL